MPDYIVSKSIVLNQLKSNPIPVREAIEALQATNQQLEQLQPRHQPVPAYQPDLPASATAQARSANGG